MPCISIDEIKSRSIEEATVGLSKSSLETLVHRYWHMLVKANDECEAMRDRLDEIKSVIDKVEGL